MHGDEVVKICAAALKRLAHLIPFSIAGTAAALQRIVHSILLSVIL